MAAGSRANRTLLSSEATLLSVALTAGSCKFANRPLESSTFVAFVFIAVIKVGLQQGSIY